MQAPKKCCGCSLSLLSLAWDFRGLTKGSTRSTTWQVPEHKWQEEPEAMTKGCNGSPDYVFRCSCCVRMIPESAPVYMRDDLTYCSASCRDRGLSRLYVNLKQSQLEGPRLPCLPKSGSLATASNYKSQSSLATKTEHTEVTDVSATTDEMDCACLSCGYN
eukprot:Skav232449  [mRNA]  locus=scaffold189:455322:462639:- [translate_table: standard]